jgi:cysteinyl-tRNA synthetase
MIRLFNTLTRKVEQFVPLKDGEVGIYSCGPTVYNFAHIGNLSTFLFVDLLKRYLKYRGFKVKHVMNLTDVDDKTIKGSRKEGVGLKEFTEKYTRIFFKDLADLNIIGADIYPKATEHIPEMVALAKRLLNKGMAYEIDGSIYFRISAFPSYGQLALLEKQKLKKGASGRIDKDEYEKEGANDFVLWKAYKAEEDGEVYWETEIGKGRPGWHIECSAMSIKYLGETFDIHTGAVDLIFPHHQNEIAQSEGATGKKFVNYWLHREHLKMGENKMSKSAGNYKILQDIATNPLDAAAFRYMVMSGHYRSKIIFSDDNLKASKQTVDRLVSFYNNFGKINKQGENKISDLIEKTRGEFIKEMDDDLNSPRAVAAVFVFINEIERRIKEDDLSIGSAKAVKLFLEEIDKVLGVISLANTCGEETLPDELKTLIVFREEARRDKDWAKSDEIRKQLATAGIQIEDMPEGPRWRRI